MGSIITQNRIFGIWENCLNVTPSTVITFAGTGSIPLGAHIDSYEWQYSNPLPSISGNTIVFAGSGKIWNILVHDIVNNPLYFLYCCEGGGNDSLNQTIHNGYAGNTTDHFLVNSATYWSKTYRDNIYRWGYSTKTALSLIVEKVTNGDFSANITSWTNSPIQAKTSSSWSASYSGSAKVTVSITLINNDNASLIYQNTGAINKIFRYVASVETNNTHTGTSGSRVLFISEGSYASDVKYIMGVGYSGSTSYVIGVSSPGANVSYTFSRKWYPVNNIFINLPGSPDASYRWHYPTASVKIYEDDVKIPSLVTDRNKDCFGNALTTDSL